MTKTPAQAIRETQLRLIEAAEDPAPKVTKITNDSAADGTSLIGYFGGPASVEEMDALLGITGVPEKGPKFTHSWLFRAGGKVFAIYDCDGKKWCVAGFKPNDLDALAKTFPRIKVEKARP